MPDGDASRDIWRVFWAEVVAVEAVIADEHGGGVLASELHQAAEH